MNFDFFLFSFNLYLLIFNWLSLIIKNIKKGSKIYSDSWLGYSLIENNPNYQHFKVNHKYNFISPEHPEVHTQNIENTWNQVKKKLKEQYGTSERLIKSYLSKYCFQRSFYKTNSQFFILILSFFTI